MDQSRRLFTQGQEKTGEAMLDAMHGSFLQRTGRGELALSTLLEAVARNRNMNFPRGELVCTVQLLKVRVASREWLQAARTAARGGLLFVQTELLRADWWLAGVKLRTGIRFAFRDYFTRKRLASDRSLLTMCPCGDDHDVAESPALP